jgi:hypothetical protein
MNRIVVAVLTATAAYAAGGQESQAQTAASAPAGWQCGSTGGGTPKWASEAAPSGRRVLKQSGNAPFPWCVKPDIMLADGFVEVKFMPLAGREDQAGGIVWRWQDGDNYYVARANALENNVSLYYTSSGVRHTIQYVDAPVAPHMWHHLRVDFKGAHITVLLDGKRYIETDDSHITAAGRVGVWTKADSVTEFDDFKSGTFDDRAKVTK